jgi:GNAT superfamily N-acetyltransferase
MRGEFQTGKVDQSRVLSLLNESFEDWGDKELFQWKYNEYPGYDPDEHAFSITIDGELAAFRRVFRKELVVDGETVPIHIYGDTAVAPKYQGRGLYSELYERTKEYSEQSDAKYVAAFNRKGNLTFDANLERGWSYRTLPLQLRILSPKAVLETYASLITDQLPAIHSLANLIGNRLHVSTSDGRLTVEEIVTNSTGSADQSVGPALSDTAVTRYVEAVSTDGNTITDLVVSSAQLAANGHISVGRPTESTTLTFGSAEPVDSSIQQAVAENELDELVSLYDVNSSFHRTREDIEHIIQYPDSDVVLARRDGAIVGYAVLGSYKNGGVIEGRVLEIQTDGDSEGVFSPLIARVESRAIERGFDLILILSDTCLGKQWASIDQQVLAWNELEQTNNHSVQYESPRITLYDIV